MPAVAIVQTAFIGDVVLATPLFEAARAARPGDRIIGVVRAGCDNLLGNNPYVDEVIVWDKHGRDRGIAGIIRLARMLRERSVDTALIPHRSLRTALALYLSGAGTRIGFAKGGGALLHNVRVPYRLGIHEVERNFMLAQAAGWNADGYSPKIIPDEQDRRIVDDIIGSIGPYCVFAPGSVWATKRWPVESYIQTGSALSERGMLVVVSGGSDDSDICGQVAAGVPGAVDTCGLLSLRQSAELYRRSRFVLTGDTAPQHIAAAMGAWVFALFGPTVRDFGFWPYSGRGVVIEENIKCRPCGVHGHRECPDRTYRCLKSITYQKVIAVIDEMIGKG